MKCPNDDITLIMSERSGIEIDYCPECRGVWLDRGELDKIIDRAAAEQAPAPAPAAPPAQSYERSYEQERDDRRTEHDQRYARASQQGAQQPYRKKKKESWLSEIFD
ncbi:zf-TFIIB domain-containing protein [Nocardioides sp.]|uniref:TFIIB-type zinc ribbon-containing protein n=1 Tax=Nocardioides sp. TaxID=35761 RepID=UPI002B9BDC2F|nr:zf-TFIIB domain-containing protein [Nocardioides sp.]HXH77645.1 zf-TFIIB domain-containing protein [Nocardioides sp.]